MTYYYISYIPQGMTMPRTEKIMTVKSALRAIKSIRSKGGCILNISRGDFQITERELNDLSG